MTCLIFFDDRGGRVVKINFSCIQKGVIQDRDIKTSVIR